MVSAARLRISRDWAIFARLVRAVALAAEMSESIDSQFTG